MWFSMTSSSGCYADIRCMAPLLWSCSPLPAAALTASCLIRYSSLPLPFFSSSPCPRVLARAILILPSCSCPNRLWIIYWPNALFSRSESLFLLVRERCYLNLASRLCDVHLAVLATIAIASCRKIFSLTRWLRLLFLADPNMKIPAKVRFSVVPN